MSTSRLSKSVLSASSQGSAAAGGRKSRLLQLGSSLLPASRDVDGHRVPAGRHRPPPGLEKSPACRTRPCRAPGIRRDRARPPAPVRAGGRGRSPGYAGGRVSGGFVGRARRHARRRWFVKVGRAAHAAPRAPRHSGARSPRPAQRACAAGFRPSADPCGFLRAERRLLSRCCRLATLLPKPSRSPWVGDTYAFDAPIGRGAGSTRDAAVATTVARGSKFWVKPRLVVGRESGFPGPRLEHDPEK